MQKDKKTLKQITLADLAKVTGGEGTVEGANEWETNPESDGSGSWSRGRSTSLKG